MMHVPYASMRVSIPSIEIHMMHTVHDGGGAASGLRVYDSTQNYSPSPPHEQFGTVSVALRNTDGKRFALKTISKRVQKAAERKDQFKKDVMNEVGVKCVETRWVWIMWKQPPGHLPLTSRTLLLWLPTLHPSRRLRTWTTSHWEGTTWSTDACSLHSSSHFLSLLLDSPLPSRQVEIMCHLGGHENIVALLPHTSYSPHSLSPTFPLQVEIMYHLGGHENIVALHEVYEDKDNVHLLLVGREFIKCGAGWGRGGDREGRDDKDRVVLRIMCGCVGRKTLISVPLPPCCRSCVRVGTGSTGC